MVNNKINFIWLLPAGAYYLWVNLYTRSVQGWYQVNTQINITRTNVSISSDIKLGKNGGLISFPNMSGILGNNSKIKVNGQVGKFYKN